VVNRRRNADESSSTPLSRSLAVAMTLKLLMAWTRHRDRGAAGSFRTGESASWTLEGIWASSSMRAMVPVSMAPITGDGTGAARLGYLGEEPGVVHP
jgi:hypothetical protein